VLVVTRSFTRVAYGSENPAAIPSGDAEIDRVISPIVFLLSRTDE
jgi:hypothetical protein